VRRELASGERPAGPGCPRGGRAPRAGPEARAQRHSGFNVNSTRRVRQRERGELEKLLQYIQRPPVSLERLSYDSGGMVTYEGRFHPRLGRDYQFVTGLEFLAMLVTHIALRYRKRENASGAAWISSTP
jgi:hypothetical protein